MAGNQYRDYIKRSFLKYAFSIISLLFVLMGLFLFINVQWISVGSNRKNNALLASALDSQVSSYKEGLEHFSTDYRFFGCPEIGKCGCRHPGQPAALRFYHIPAHTKHLCPYRYRGTHGKLQPI